jgi:hypothetical protein
MKIILQLESGALVSNPLTGVVYFDESIKPTTERPAIDSKNVQELQPE